MQAHRVRKEERLVSNCQSWQVSYFSTVGASKSALSIVTEGVDIWCWCILYKLLPLGSCALDVIQTFEDLVIVQVAVDRLHHHQFPQILDGWISQWCFTCVRSLQDLPWGDILLSHTTGDAFRGCSLLLLFQSLCQFPSPWWGILASVLVYPLILYWIPISKH